MRSAKCNESIYFVLSVKLRQEIALPQTLLNALFSMQIIFITFFRKSIERNFQWQHTFVIFFTETIHLTVYIFCFPLLQEAEISFITSLQYASLLWSQTVVISKYNFIIVALNGISMHNW